MPRTKPSETVEHRMTLGTYERKLANRKIFVDGITGIGFGTLGLGALLAGVGLFAWGGGSVKRAVESVVEGTKDFVQKAADTGSSIIVSELPRSPPAERAIEIGIRIKEIHARQAEITTTIQTLQAAGNVPMATIAPLLEEGMALSQEEDRLREELDRIASGNVPWWYVRNDAGEWVNPWSGNV